MKKSHNYSLSAPVTASLTAIAAALAIALAAYGQQPGAQKPTQAPGAQPGTPAAQPTTPAAQPATPAAAPAKPMRISVNGVLIPQTRIDYFMKQRAQQGQPDSPDAAGAVKEDLINRELLAQEAVRSGFDKTPEVVAQLDVARQGVLARAYLQDYVKKFPIKDETLKTEYDRVKASVGDKEFKASHVLLEKEEEAKEIIAQLKKGAAFEKIAKEKSKDTGSKAEGGKLDWSNRNSFVPPFTEAMMKLQKGQFTQEPVKTQFGFHVIKLDDVRPLKAPPFDEVKESIRQNQQQQLLAKIMADLRQKAKIEEK